jgi:hypothetical protein
MHEPDLPCGPGKKRNLVNRGIEGDAVTVLLQKLSDGTAKSLEPINKCGRKDVHVVGPAIMTYVPDHLNRFLLGGLYHGRQGRKVITATSVNQMPTRSIADCAKSKLPEQTKIFRGQSIVLRSVDHIQTDAVSSDMRRGFETSHPE